MLQRIQKNTSELILTLSFRILMHFQHDWSSWPCFIGHYYMASLLYYSKWMLCHQELLPTSHDFCQGIHSRVIHLYQPKIVFLVPFARMECSALEHGTKLKWWMHLMLWSRITFILTTCFSDQCLSTQHQRDK